MRLCRCFGPIVTGAILFAGCVDSGETPAPGSGGPGTLTVVTTGAKFAVSDNPYASTLEASGGTQPYFWKTAGGLPVWATLNPNTAQILGAPSNADIGTSTPIFEVVDSLGNIARGKVVLAVHPRTDRVSVNNLGESGTGPSSIPSISGDGSLIVFTSSATNFTPPAVGQQIYMHDRGSNKISLISSDNSAASNPGNGSSNAPVISLDGKSIAFVSQATNLLAPGTPSLSGQHIYVKDSGTGLTSLVSKNNNGISGDGLSSAPAISADGRYVAFTSLSTNLVTGVSGQQVYRHDRQTGQTSLVSKSSGGIPGGGVSGAPGISADGRFIAFVSSASNLVEGVSGQQVYLRDTETSQTTLLSQSTGGLAGNGDSSSPSISSDGPFAKVTFTSLSTNLQHGASSRAGGALGSQIYVRDTQTSITSLVSKDNNAVPDPGNGASSASSISSDGRYVAFVSDATNLLAPAVSPPGPQIYQRDIIGNVTSLVSKNNSGNPASAGVSNFPTVATNGAYVAFASSATNLVATPTAAATDIYVRALP